MTEREVAASATGSPATSRVTSERVSLRFDGGAVVDGTISARAMGQALQGMANLVQSIAGTGGFGEHSTPELRIVATEEGSFELGLLLQALGEWWAAARPVLTSPDAAAAGNLVTFATVVGGVLKFFRDKGGRKIKDRTFNDQGQVESHLDDGSTLVSNVEVAEAADHPRVQGAVKEVIAPLAYLGIDTVSIETVNLTVNINSEEARRIPDPEPEADPTRTTVRYEAWASFNRPHFGGTKWGVLLPGKSFQAFIEDGTFLAEVEAGNVSLNAYDEFRVVVREEPYVTAGGQRRIHRYVERVLERREPERGSDAERTLPEEDEGAA